MHPEELEFIRSLKSGDAAAFRKLVDDLKDKVYNTCISILRDEADAEDATQEVFITVHTSIRNFKGVSSLSTWIYRITTTKALDLLRKKMRQKRWGKIVRIVTGKEDKALGGNQSFYHPGVQLENKEKAAQLFQAISTLNEKQKTAFILHHTEGLSHKEISEIMNTTISSVESLIHRAKQNLKNYLNENYFKD